MIFDINANIVNHDVMTATELMWAVASGRKILQMIGSRSGFGKTTIAKKQLRLCDIIEEKPNEREPRRGGRFIEVRPTAPISLVRKLWRCHLHRIGVLLFDDPGGNCLGRSLL